MLVCFHRNLSGCRSAARIAGGIAMDNDMSNCISIKLVLKCWSNYYTCHLAFHGQDDAIVTLCTCFRSGTGHIVGTGYFVGIRLVCGYREVFAIHVW